ncbi:MAG: hypothetical protein SNH71_04430 [Rikenellaceae bacterium]
MFINLTQANVFNKFSELYHEKIIKNCSILGKFKIKVYTSAEYDKCKDNMPILIESIHESSFSYYVNKESHDASTTDAAIVFNEELCDTLELTEEEQMSAIAHEIGHIIDYFRENKSDNNQAKEIYADSIACKLDLTDYLLSTLKKILSSETIPEELKSQIQTRMRWIRYHS